MTASPRELLPDVSRPGLLNVVRVALAGLALLAAATAGGAAPPYDLHLAVPTAAYLLVTAVAELVRPRLGRGHARLVGGMLVVDVLYVTATVALTGGPRGLLGVLVPLHVAAASLLFSHRTGLRLAVGYSLLLVGEHYLAATQPLAAGRASAAEASLAVTGFWAVAVAVGAFSALNERELVRGRDRLRVLSEMAARLEQIAAPGEVAAVLAEHVATAFPAGRVAVAVDAGGGATVVARADPKRGEAPATAITATDPSPPHRATELSRRLDPVRDPALAEALPGATNVVVLPLTAGDTALGAVAVECGGGPRTRLGSASLRGLEHFAAHGALALRNARLRDDLARLARSDPLTGLFNRRGFDDAFRPHIARAQRTGEPISLVVMDIDHFKRVNDEHGHDRGDEVLRHVGRRLLEAARSMDVCGRLGGEEFAVLLPACGPTEAVAAAERLRSAIADAPPLPVTASAGVATLGLHVGDPADLTLAADEALYAAKRGGRDRTTLSTRRAGATAGV